MSLAAHHFSERKVQKEGKSERPCRMSNLLLLLPFWGESTLPFLKREKFFLRGR